MLFHQGGSVMLSDFDKEILNAIQDDIPLVPCPFAVIAERLHIDESALMERLAMLKENGYLSFTEREI